MSFEAKRDYFDKCTAELAETEKLVHATYIAWHDAVERHGRLMKMRYEAFGELLIASIENDAELPRWSGLL